MAITKNLIHFNEKTKFEEKLANNEILDTSIVFIKDTQEIYTHGQLYKCADQDLSIYLTTTNAGNTYATITTANGLQENIDDVITDLQEYKTTVASTYITPNEVDTKIAALVDSAPTTLDTLNELAAALGDDPNFATTVATNIGKIDAKFNNYLPIIGGRLKGELKINTEAENDNQKFGFFKTDNSNQNNYGCLQIGTNVGAEKPIGITLSGCDPTLTANGTDKYGLCVVGLGKGYTTQELKDLTRNSDKTERCRVVVNGNLLMENGKIIGTADAADSVPWTGVTGRPTSLPASDVYAWAKKSSLALEDVPDLSSKYLPLSGGMLTGNGADILTVNRQDGNPVIEFRHNGSLMGRYGFATDGTPIGVVAGSQVTLIHSGNVGSQNAGSATKLQTARTIWGQSFDGTGNVSGALSGVANINSALYINSSGNVTIGGSDTAGTDYKLRVDGKSRFTDRVSVTSLRIVPVNGSFVADFAMDGSSLTLNRELKFTNVPASDICSGIAASFKTSLAQAESLIARNIILGASSGSASNLALNFQKYTSISNTAPSGLTTLMTLTTDGNLGIGTATPEYKLDVAGEFKASSVICGTSRLRVNVSGNAGVFGFIDALPFQTTTNVASVHIGSCYGGQFDITNIAESPSGQSMTAISIYRGRVGIGKRWSDTELRALHDANCSLGVWNNASIGGSLTVGAGAAITGAVTIDGETAATQTWVTSQGYITGITAGTGLTGGGTSGNVTLGLTNTYQTYISNGNTAYSWGNHSGKYLPIEGGTCTGAITATAFYQSSDETLKVFGDDISIDFNALKRIPKKYFNWKDGNGTIEIGTGAQSLQKVYPELVTESNGHLVVAYDKLSIIALKAIDVLHAENQELKNRLTKLEEMVYGNRY